MIQPNLTLPGMPSLAKDDDEIMPSDFKETFGICSNLKWDQSPMLDQSTGSDTDNDRGHRPQTSRESIGTHDCTTSA